MQDHRDDDYDSGAGCLTRLYWMFLGNALWLILLGLLIRDRPRFPSFLDAGCLLTLASLVYVRYIDIRHLNGQTGDCGAPATMDDWRKYSRRVVGLGLAVWLALRILSALFSK